MNQRPDYYNLANSKAVPDKTPFGWWKIGIAIAFLCIPLLIGSCVYNGVMPNYSNGERSGVVYKVSRKGIIWKSYEAEMNLGGVTTQAAKSGSSIVPNVWRFSVIDDSVKSRLDAAAKSGARVNVTYRQYLISPIYIEENYVATAVEDAQ